LLSDEVGFVAYEVVEEPQHGAPGEDMNNTGTVVSICPSIHPSIYLKFDKRGFPEHIILSVFYNCLLSNIAFELSDYKCQF